MSRLFLALLTLLSGLIIFSFAGVIQAQEEKVVIERHVIVTPAPVSNNYISLP